MRGGTQPGGRTLSDIDSFIEEVTEEVRRDRLFRLMRKYGWIAILLVVVVVAGASYNEWQKARARAAAQAFGDSLLAALQENDPSDRVKALMAIRPEGEKAAIVAFVTAAEQDRAGDKAAAAATLEKIAGDESLSEEYRQLAVLKIVLLRAGDMPPQDRMARMQPLTQPGAPYRVLAEEQIAVAEIDKGDNEAAIKRLKSLLNDTEATSGLRRRASQLIVALGGKLEPA